MPSTAGTGTKATKARSTAAKKAATTFDLTAAKAMAEAAEAKANEMGLPIVFAAVDASGVPILLHRMPGSLLASVKIAEDKAFTSAAIRVPTAALKDLSAPGGDLAAIENSHGGRIVIFGGGLPVTIGDEVVGGIGVSGGTADEDVEVVTAALAAL